MLTSFIIDISRCMFNGERCGPDNFTITLTNHGVCFTFNSIENEEALTVTSPGTVI